jgi:ligand-binding sensor domain-containing protein/signal transduction histidine kinase
VLAQGLNPVKAVTQYTQDVWTSEAGLPNNSITAIAQTQDGYLWVGTEEGLARFDGDRFKLFDKQNTRALLSNHISALFPSSDRTLWIGTQGGGLTQFRDGTFRTYTSQDGLANDAVLALDQDQSGALWIGTNGGGLQRFKDGQFRTYTTRDGLPNNSIFGLSEAKDGSLWIGTHAGLVHFEKNSFRTYTTKDGLRDAYIKCVYVGSAGDVWAGTNQGGVSRFVNGRFITYTSGDGLLSDTIWSIYQDRLGTIWIGTNDGGLSRFVSGVLSTYSIKQGLPADTVMSTLADREGNLWIGTRGGGLVRLKDSPFTVFTSREGLSNDVVLPVFQDHTGAIWLGTNGGGLNRLQDGKITAYSTRNGLSDNLVLSIAEDQEQALWIATHRGLDRLKGGKIKRFGSADGLPTDVVVSLYTDHNGILWAGSRAGLSRFDGRHFITYTTKDGLPHDYVVALFEDKQKTLWIGTGGGGLVKFSNGRFTAFTKRNGLSSDSIWSITGDSDGTLWIGTSGGGLNRFSNGRFTAYTVRDGLLDDEIFAVLSDERGYLWMSSNKGIFRVSKSELNGFAEGRVALISPTVYGTSEGLRNKECNGGFQPAGWRTTDGRLLFPTMKGLAILDSKRIVKNALPPPVNIEQLTIDGTAFNPSGAVKAEPGKGQLQFDFTALSLVSPDKVRFRYRLDDFDKDWVDAGSRRSAYYTNIPPGEYRFSVIACNNDGVWNTRGASVSLSIAPHFYQTKTFLLLCICLFGSLCFAMYALRIRQLKAHERKLMLLVEERTQSLQNEVYAKERARAELAEAQQHLMELSRLSGRAEVASGVLHNVGNVLNSVNVGASVITSKLRDLRFEKLSAALNMLQEHSDDLSTFVATDAKGQRILPYLVKLASHLRDERQQILSEVEALTSHVDHMKEIVATHQDYAKASTLVETLSPSKLIDDALRMVLASFERHHIEVIRDIDNVPEILAPKHRILEILVNLLRNAKQSVIERNAPVRQIRISVTCHGKNDIRFEVRDSGVGIAPENLTRIFAHGFTTKRNGHGFGLHSSALAARQMNGSLRAESQGVGCGATFIFEVPVKVVSATETEIVTV